ncbi:MAG: hypothetical protein LBG14_03940 [Treponema sp.]|nr:hypothetical protein [Treponema sp.]
MESENSEVAAMARTDLSRLRELGAAASHFPSIRKKRIFLGKRDAHKLIASITSPARVAAVYNYLLAKSHIFSMLSFLTQDRKEYYIQARHVIFTVTCTLMLEDVYFSCLMDSSLPDHVRSRLANDLVGLLDSGSDPRVVEHLPALEALWTARGAAPPSFGTMDGASELARITLDLGDDWHAFLVESISNDETRFALEEFLFGISYEEILEVRSRLSRFGISAVGADEVRSYLGSNPAYSIVDNKDPQTAYEFYIARQDAAQWRKTTNAPGPQKTLEELYLKHRIVLELSV